MKVEQYISIAIACSALLLVSCKREERGFRVQPPAARAANSQTLSDLQPGSTTTPAGIRNEYEENAYALSEGRRLYSAYNCNGCHAQGGGGMGPPLMDGLWIYGGKPEQVFSTIVEGRPNGMPSFRAKGPEFQVWERAAAGGAMRKRRRPRASTIICKENSRRALPSRSRLSRVSSERER